MNELQGRVRYVRGERSLISGRTYNELARLLRNLSSETIQIGIGSNGGLKLEIGSFGVSGGGGGGGGSGGGGHLYTGPFALSYANGTVTIAYGYIIAGITTRAVSQSTLQVSLPMSPNLAYIYIDVSSPGAGNISTSYGSDVSIVTAHTQTDAVFRVCIGTVDASGVCAQWQHGDIYVSGRLV